MMREPTKSVRIVLALAAALGLFALAWWTLAVDPPEGAPPASSPRGGPPDPGPKGTGPHREGIPPAQEAERDRTIAEPSSGREGPERARGAGEQQPAAAPHRADPGPHVLDLVALADACGAIPPGDGERLRSELEPVILAAPTYDEAQWGDYLRFVEAYRIGLERAMENVKRCEESR